MQVRKAGRCEIVRIEQAGFVTGADFTADGGVTV